MASRLVLRYDDIFSFFIKNDVALEKFKNSTLLGKTSKETPDFKISKNHVEERCGNS